MTKKRFVPILVSIALLSLIITQTSDALCSASTNIALLQLSEILANPSLRNSVMVEDQDPISCSLVCNEGSMSPSQALVVGYQAWFQGNPENAVHTWESHKVDISQSFIAVGRYYHIRKQYDEAVFWYESLLSMFPETAGAWNNLALVLQDQECWDEAIMAYQRSIDLGIADNIVQYSSLLAAQQLYGEQATLLTTALEQYPIHADRLTWWRDLVVIYRTDAQWQNVHKAASQAVREFPNDVSLLTDYAYAQYQIDKDVESATAILDRAMVIDPSYAAAYGRMGEIMFSAKHYEEAAEWLAKAVELNPMSRWWYVNQARAVMQAGHPEQAIVLYLETVENFPDYAYGYFELAKAYYIQGNATAAYQAITIAIQLQQPSLPAYYVLAGQIQISLGQLETAKYSLNQALEIQPGYPAAIKELEQLQAEMDK